MNIPTKPPAKTSSLHRNKACLNCRARKTKCDAVKPICSACSKLAPKDHPKCRYDSTPKWFQSVLRSKEQEQDRVIELEHRLTHLQQRLDSLRLTRVLELDTPHLQPQQNSYGVIDPNVHQAVNCFPFIPRHNPFVSSILSSPTPSTNPSIPDLPPSPPPPIHLPSTQSSSTDSFLLPSEPNWLHHLPPRHTCKVLLKAFFSRPLSPFTLVDPVALQSHIDLSCADPHFPEPALIHAVCAIGSQYVTVQELLPAYWSPPSDPPHLHHARWAERLLNDGILSYHQHYHPKFEPSKLIQLSEVAVLCCQYYTLVGKPLMIWKSLGYSTRLATLLGLHTPPYCPSLDISTRPQSISSSASFDDLVTLWPDGVGVLENTPDHRVQHHRTILWWYVFCCDKMCAAAGGFASTIDEKDSLIPIYNPPPATSPSSSASLGANIIMSSDQILFNNIQHRAPLYLPKSPGFFFYHQIGDFDSLQLLIKVLSAHALIHTAFIQMNEDLVELNAENLDQDQEDEDETEEHLKICKESGKVMIEWFLELIRWKNLGLIQADLGDLLCGNPALNFGLSVALRTHCRFIAIHKYRASFSQRDHQIKLLHLDRLQFQIHLILIHLKESQKMPLEGRIVELISFLLNSPWALIPKKKTKPSPPLSSTTAIINGKKTNQVVTINVGNYNYLNNDNHDYFNPSKKAKTGFAKPLSELTDPKSAWVNEYHCDRSKYNLSTDTHDLHSMVSNFALAKLLDSQI